MKSNPRVARDHRDQLSSANAEEELVSSECANEERALREGR
jgi:hypothetical protein